MPEQIDPDDAWLSEPADRCRDCGRPITYGEDDAYHHTTEPERGCFLIPAEPVR